MDPKFSDILAVKKEVFASAEQFNSSQTGIVVAATAAFLTLSYLVSILFLVFASMGVALLFYRILLYSRPKDPLEKSLRAYDELLTRQTQLHQLELPPDEKKRFAEHLTHLLELREREERRLLLQPKKR